MLKREHSHRPERVADLIQQELAWLLEAGINDPRVGFVTITSVRVSPNLHTARVGVTVLGDEQQKEESLNGLRAAQGFLRRQLARRLNLRNTPELTFEPDLGMEAERRIDELLRQVRSRNDGES